MSDCAIEIKSLSKKYGKVMAVDDLDLDVEKGCLFGLLGPNGAGKTTTLKILAGLTKPDSGNIKILGKSVSFGSIAGREKIGYLPDVPECYGYMTPVQYLKFCSDLYGMDEPTAKKNAYDLLELVGLENTQKKIAGFSRGMKQRMGIAQALINEPETVLMDEPASALDPTGRYEVMEILKRLKGKTTVFFSTHIISDIERVCDEVAVISKGKVLERGTVGELKTKYDKKNMEISFPGFILKNQLEDFKLKLNQQEWCEEITDMGKSVLKIRVVDRETAQKRIVHLLAENGLAIDKMDSLAISLEDIFLEVVKK